jgi:uncharacterized protein (TIGR00369 family)
MTPRNPDFKHAVATIFNGAPFIADLGIELVEVGAGWVETRLMIQPRHLQQHDFIHAGVQATIADHSAGAAAGSLCAEDETILTAEFKINLLRAAKGEMLRCHAEVLKPGRMLTVAESEVYTLSGGKETLVSKATVTLAVIKQNQADG